MKKDHNAFVALLSMLHVRHTTAFSEKLFEEHPNKNNLLGLSQMLNEYKIENSALRVKDTLAFDLSAIEAPFIAQVSNDFVPVYKVTTEKIYYLWNGVKIDVTHDEFKQNWSGVLLVAEANENSIEPGYDLNRKVSFWNSAKKYLLLTALTLTLVYAFITNQIYDSCGLVVLSLVNLAGVYTCYLLALKQLNIQSNYADKLCTLFKKSDCNNILESKAAKLGGVIGWSEIGLGYFISNLIIVVAFPALVPYMSLINIAALPYTVWSVWYQKYKAKQWCPLCLIVQLLLWCVFAVVALFGYITIPSFGLNEIVITGIIYILPVAAISLIMPLISQSRKGRRIAQELNSLKTSEEIFTALLSKQPYHKSELSDSQIVFGNPEAKMRITIFSNPHCNPCALMHKRVEKLLAEAGDRLSVQYVFSSFNKELESSALHMLAIYLGRGMKEAQLAYDEWFERGKNNKESFFSKYGQDISQQTVINEYERHRAWSKTNRLSGTPTIMINGYILPDIYRIEEMIFFTETEINSKSL